MEKKIDVKKHWQRNANAVVIELTDGTFVEVISQPEGSDYNLHVHVESSHPVKIDFTVREK
jgi:hypothetical protein